MRQAHNAAAGFAAIAALGLLLLTAPLVANAAADDEVDAPVDSRATAANINTSRSNTKGLSNDSEDAAAPAATGDCDDTNDCRVPPGIAPAPVAGLPPGTAAAVAADDEVDAPVDSRAKAANINTSRSNKKTSAIRDDVNDAPCPDCDEACTDCAPAQPQGVPPRR